MIPNNACPFRITAAAGTELAGASFGGTVRWPRVIPRAPSFPLTGVYNPKAFILHAALLRQACAHCAKFPTAASRRSLARVSVPVWLIILSDQLPIVALVGRYPTNQLMGRKLIPNREHRREAHFPPAACTAGPYPVLAPLSEGYPRVRGRLLTCYAPVRHCTQRPKSPFSSDLHVLSTPPAFVLSQDQTLRNESRARPSLAAVPRTHLPLPYASTHHYDDCQRTEVKTNT